MRLDPQNAFAHNSLDVGLANTGDAAMLVRIQEGPGARTGQSDDSRALRMSVEPGTASISKVR